MSQEKTLHKKSRSIRYVISLLAAVVLIALCSDVYAAPKPTVSAKLDSTTLLMGRTMRLHLQVDKDKAVAGHFPLFTDADPRPYATILGDTIELSKTIASDTSMLADGRQRITYHVPIQVYDSGYYHIPGFEYVAAGDTILSNTLELKVVPVQAAATDKISGMTDVADPEGGNWLDKVPDWILQYWWVILALHLLGFLLIYLIRKWIKNRAKKPTKKPDLPPYEEAMRSLATLKERELWQHGENELYFVTLTGILRRYLSRRFSVSAPEMTTEQFLDEASRHEKLTGYSSELRRLLVLADFIKFARGQSLPGENEEAFVIVRKFVEDTKPTKEEEEAIKAAAEAPKPVKAKVKQAKMAGKAGKRNKKKGGKK